MTSQLTIEQLQKLQEWQEAVNAAFAVKSIIEKEQTLRKEVAALIFPQPVEGTNNQNLNEGWQLKYTYKIDRKVDEGVLEAVMVKLREMKVNPDLLVNRKPTLDTKAYKSLVQINSGAAKVFEEALTIKPGSSTLELIPPKKKD